MEKGKTGQSEYRIEEELYMTEEMKNCSYCAEGELLDAFGIKIGELPMSKVILLRTADVEGDPV